MPPENGAGRSELAARAFWSGTLTFGLVSIPVNLFPANRSRRVSLRMLSPEGTPLARRYVCPEEEREVERDEIVRGYELEEGTFVVLTDDELERLAPERTRDIDLRRFVPREQLDALYFDRAYFLAPAGESTKPYRLLAATMEASGRAGIATFVMRGKEYLIAILAENGILRAETLRFHDEVRSPEDVGLPDPEKPPAAEIKRMEKAIRAREKDALDESELEDAWSERVRALAERKRKRGRDVVEVEVDGEEEDEEEGVIDLMEVLKRSLEGTGRRPHAAAGRRAGRHSGRADDLEELSKQELYERAREREIEGRSTMSKDELIRALRRSA